MLKFSVVIPVYNVEQYLPECIESLIAQCFKNYEIILVDDGSNDASSQICDDYAQKNSYIKVVHTENRGLSSARNIGIRIANAEYVIFIDSDDFLSDVNFLQKANDAISYNSPDILIYGFSQFRNSDNKVIRTKYAHIELINTVYSFQEKLLWLVSNDNLSVSAWTHICKRTFIIDNNLLFNDKVRVSEDIDWLIRVMLLEPNLYAMDNVSYMYRSRKNSLSTFRVSGKWKYRYNAIKRSVEFVEQSKADIKTKEALYSYLSYQFYLTLSEIASEQEKKERILGYELISPYTFLMSFGRGRKEKISRFFIKFLGIKLGSCLLLLYSRISQKRKMG